MRIVTFTSSNIPNYDQFGGVQDFGKTELSEGNCIGEYFGSLDEAALPSYGGDWPLPGYRTKVNQGELIDILGTQPYAKIYRAAYPQGNKSEDDIALFFLERAKYPTSEDGLIDVTDSIVTDALDYFIAQGYMDAEDKARVIQGYTDS